MSANRVKFTAIITHVLNKATAKVEEQKRNILHSSEKAKCEGRTKHWKLRLQKAKGLRADDKEARKSQDLCQPVQEEEDGREFCADKLRLAKEMQNEMKK